MSFGEVMQLSEWLDNLADAQAEADRRAQKAAERK